MNKIAILGCGVTGMITALALANKGIACSIYDATALDKAPLDVRTTVFTNNSKIFFEQAGIWQILEPYAAQVKDIYVLDNRSALDLCFRAQDVGVAAMGHLVANMTLKAELFTAVQNSALINIKPNAQVDELLTSSAYDLILVCDGRASKALRYFPQSYIRDYKQTALVMVAEHELPHEGIAVEHFMPNGPFAILPMQHPNQSSIVWTEPTELSNIYKTLSAEELTAQLQYRFGEFLGKVKIVSDVQYFALHAQITKRYYADNMVLVGDAAHAIHPLAGQGLNQGIKDIEALVEIIAGRVNVGLKIDELALMEYERARKWDNWRMFGITDGLDRIFSHKIFPFAQCRKVGLHLFDSIGMLKHTMMRHTLGSNQTLNPNRD